MTDETLDQKKARLEEMIASLGTESEDGEPDHDVLEQIGDLREEIAEEDPDEDPEELPPHPTPPEVLATTPTKAPPASP